VQAAELRRYGITSNALAPSARTGMTAGVFGDRMKPPEDGSFDHFHPGNVAPLVVWLGSELSGHVTGRVFEVEGGKIAIGDGWHSTAGVDKGDRWAPAEVGAAMEQLLATELPAQKVYGA
jgi:NAD(P)-dependent dehydrogenase (short-subunit alcohol dehydrogenase family)